MNNMSLNYVIIACLTVAGTDHSALRHGTRGGGLMPPPADWPLIELELRGKDERMARNEMNPTAFSFLVLGHLVTPEVMSMT